MGKSNASSDEPELYRVVGDSQIVITASLPTSTWTPEEIRQHASSWSLEADAKLLHFMKGISDGLERRASNTTDRIHRLRLNVDRTNVALENVTNQLSALQHSQFVENRVYEDDETIANVSEVPTGDEINENNKYDPIDTLKKLLDTSMEVVNRCYDKVSIDIQDSDEEEDSQKSVIYRPKDPYANRPLPHIIGSKEWTQKWHVGLYDSDDDLSGDEREGDFSESSESASMSASLPSNAPTMSESELSAWGFQQNASENLKRRVELYGSSEEDIKQSLDDNRFVPNPVPYNNTPYQEPESKYYVHQPKQKDRGLFDDSSSESTDSELYNVKGSSERTVPKRSNQISNIFSDEPPPDLDVVDRQDKPNIDLFCESEEEENIPRQSSSVDKKEETQHSNIRKKTVNLFDDDDFDSFMKELNTKTQQKAELPNKIAKNLFDESSDEEMTEGSKNAKFRPSKDASGDEGVSVPKSRSIDAKEIKTESNSILQKPMNTEALFGDTAKDVAKDTASLSTRPDIFNSNSETKLFDDEILDDHGDIRSTQPPPAREKTIITNLFNDEPPDDDFDSLFRSDASSDKNLTKPATPKMAVSKIVKKGLFDDSDDDEILDTAVRHQIHVNESVGNNNAERKAGTVSGTPTRADLFGENTARSDSISIPDNTQSESNTANISVDETHEDSSQLFGGKTKILFEEKNESPPQSDDFVLGIEPVTQKNDISFAAIRKQSDAVTDRISENEVADMKVQADSSATIVLEKRKEIQLQETEDGNQHKIEQEQNRSLDGNNAFLSDIPDYVQESKTALDSVFEDINAYVVNSGSAPKPDRGFPTNLFNDVPPDDDNLSMTKSMESTEDMFDLKSEEKVLSPNESSVASVQASLKHSPEINSDSASTSQTYNSFSFFDDTPPDDDFEATPQKGKKLHSIFYDDFSETIVPSQIDSRPKSLSSFIFSEPPPDTEESNSSSALESKLPNIDATPPENVSSEEKTASTIQRTNNDNPEASDDRQPAKVHPPPRKLNSKLNINVAALLPGAKMPSLKSMQAAKTVEEITPDIEPAITKPLIPKSAQPLVSESDPKMLHSLNKSRPKIQAKRRPSTRKARKEHYRQSLIDEQNEDVSNQNKESSSNLVYTTVNSETTIKNVQSNAPIVSAVVSPDISTPKEDKAQAEVPTRELFKEGALSKTGNKMIVGSSGTFPVSDPPDDSHELTLETADSHAKTRGLFADDESNHDDEDPLPPIPSVVPKSTLAPTKVIGGEQSRAGATSGYDKKLTPSLFDDESDDDLFGTRDSSITSVAKTNQKNITASLASTESKPQAQRTSNSVKTIFGSDDDDDDLFGSAIASKIKPAPKVPSIRPDSSKQSAKNQSSLFDDNDDDDDLFGGTASKQKTVSKSEKSDAAPKKPIIEPTKVLTTNKNFDDPLADLFKDT